MLPTNEIFETIQGEAAYAGTPSVFVRLQGCPVGCPWCDTKHTWNIKPERIIDLVVLREKTAEDDSFAMLDESDICRECRSFLSRHVVITGGEPCLYDLRLLTDLLHAQGFSTQLETSGTFPIQCDPRTWVTVSPKFDMPGGRPVLHGALSRANEIKLPVGKMADVIKYRERIVPFIGSDIPIWVQPLSQNKTATAVCIEAAKSYGLRVSIQTHKYINVR